MSAVLTVGLLGGLFVPASLAAATTTTSTAASVPRAPKIPTKVCGRAALLNGPSSPPAGSMTVTPAQNLPDVVAATPANTTFWLAPGTYTFGPHQYAQVIPKNGDRFIGAPGAVINGHHENDYAFAQTAIGVTIEYLTIENFGTWGGNNNQGVVNHDSGVGWVVKDNTIKRNAGAGVMIGSHDVVEDNCLTQNQQYGFNAYSPDGVSGVVLQGNEISYNDTYGYDTTSGYDCGCAGGGKFWETVGATVTGNYVHDNQDPGLWVDTDNAGFNITGNYIAHNSAEGLIYEISYNAFIADNTFVDNGWAKGVNKGLKFPTTAIYISESGSDPRVQTPYDSVFQITGNDFINNWGGVIMWENANRACGVSNDDACTLVQPAVYTLKSCRSHIANSTPARHPDYFDNCRWKTQNVMVSHNVFSLNPGRVPHCTAGNGCGYNGIFSEYGSSPPFAGTAVESHITFDQHNRFFDNTYIGPWNFMVQQLGSSASWNTWRRAPYRQDAGSS